MEPALLLFTLIWFHEPNLALGPRLSVHRIFPNWNLHYVALFLRTSYFILTVETCDNIACRKNSQNKLCTRKAARNNVIFLSLVVFCVVLMVLELCVRTFSEPICKYVTGILAEWGMEALAILPTFVFSLVWVISVSLGRRPPRPPDFVLVWFLFSLSSNPQFYNTFPQSFLLFFPLLH